MLKVAVMGLRQPILVRGIRMNFRRECLIQEIDQERRRN
jgi:hypothetical protein